MKPASFLSLLLFVAAPCMAVKVKEKQKETVQRDQLPKEKKTRRKNLYDQIKVQLTTEHMYYLTHPTLPEGYRLPISIIHKHHDLMPCDKALRTVARAHKTINATKKKLTLKAIRAKLSENECLLMCETPDQCREDILSNKLSGATITDVGPYVSCSWCTVLPSSIMPQNAVPASKMVQLLAQAMQSCEQNQND